ncbi:MAG: GAF domain-containing protein [Anaerolineales bacterium]|nr:GAF domain-containing protein [Anaerolineales bacterium]
MSYTLIDANGLALLDTEPSKLNLTYQDRLFFTEPFDTRQPYLSDVLFPENVNVPIIYLAAPILNTNGQSIGVLLATYNASVLQTMLQTAVGNHSSGKEYAFLIDDVYFINLGHSTKPDLLYKTYLNLDDTTLSFLQGKNLLKQDKQGALLAPQLEIVDALRQMGQQTSFQAPSLEYGEMAESAAARVPNTRWIVVAAQPVSAIAALTQDQTHITVTSSAIILMVAAVIALLASNYFTRPIIQLTQVAEKISARDFKQKALVRSNDEIGILGKTFNTMADEIQGLIGSLEERVALRTSEMEKATAQSEKRAKELQTIAEIARYISTEKDLEKLLPLITHTVSERFGFYHVGVFLLNDTKKFAVLRAANSPGGQVMLKRQHKLEVGQKGIVGNVTATAAPRIALDTGADAAYFNNPDLPETHSEMALPLSARGEVIGALDVQSVEINAFTTLDVSILSLLADQIAIAIDNARLLEESKKALAESQSFFREYLTDAWQTKASSNVIGYYQTTTGGKPLTRSSAQEADVLTADEQDALAVPIQLRGQTIGALNVRVNKNREALSTEQVNIIESVTERLGLALENARLFEETSTRATREQLVTEITAKIRGTNDPQEMIQIAVDELKRALGASRIEIIPKKTAPQKDQPKS